MEKPEKERIFTIEGEVQFEETALRIFRYQASQNPVYSSYIKFLRKDPERITSIGEIPFLPISFFKSHRVYTGIDEPAVVFESSRTTGDAPSRHYLSDPDLYNESLVRGFERVYGSPSDWCILSLLPSYLERGNSSLVYMMDQLMRLSGHPDNGFYLDAQGDLLKVLEKRAADKFPVLLVGVSFALLDLAEVFRGQLPEHSVIMETGGMKGRRKELIRSELHAILKTAFGSSAIHSEYGMTELLSQAYSTGGQLFSCPPWMKIYIRDTYDPFSMVPAGQTGGINIIDLANIHSCSFIATSDLGRLHSDGRFEVLGRFDQAEVRGCNLMVS